MKCLQSILLLSNIYQLCTGNTKVYQFKKIKYDQAKIGAKSVVICSVKALHQVLKCIKQKNSSTRERKEKKCISQASNNRHVTKES